MDIDDQRIRAAAGEKNVAALRSGDHAGDAKVAASYRHARAAAIARGDNLDGDAKVAAALRHARQTSGARGDRDVTVQAAMRYSVAANKTRSDARKGFAQALIKQG